ncbi:MAG: metalloregulator ArsR/SmtB family transcription factor, partial [Mariprofundaceae bacterium]|nr:metalloregulator ArsR/SmtB family transcription factor [Mariprofundaceae bacterium]
YPSPMQTIPQESIREASEGLRAIAHELRLAVLCHLMNGPMCVAELMLVTDASQSNLSQHLTKMRLMGIVQNERRGVQVYYRIANPDFEGLLMALKTIYCPEMCE